VALPGERGASIMDREAQLLNLVPELVSLLQRGAEPKDALYWVLVVLSEGVGCESTGIRWKDGEDYPYYITRGFGPDFVGRERSLCDRDAGGAVLRDHRGSVRLACLCGAVVAGNVDSAQPCFTSGGSFWTNGLTELLRSSPPVTETITLRGECHRSGYESLALIPLRTNGSGLGLIQLNSRQEGRFTAEQVEQYEGVAGDITAAVADRIET
jgi:hypothetical protein